MSNIQFHFETPLLFLLLIPLIAFTLLPYFRMNKRYRRTRNRIISMILHLTVSLLAVMALVGTTISYDIPNEQNEMIILVDSSYSNQESQEDKIQFVESIIQNSNGNFRIGIVAFGYNAYTVVDLTRDTGRLANKYAAFLSDEANQLIEENKKVDTSATDIANALNYAMGIIDHPETAKIVILSDGVETDGAASSAIRAVNASGTKVDAVYFGNEKHPEVQIVGVVTPEDGIAINTEIALQVSFQAREACNATITVRDDQRSGEAPIQHTVSLSSGSQSVNVPFSINDKYGIHKLSFEVEVNDASNYDTETVNNSYNTYLNVPSFNHILMIERYAGESDALFDVLTKEGMDPNAALAFPDYEIERINMATDAEKLPSTIEQLCDYHEVILVNVSEQDLLGVNLTGVPKDFDVLLNTYVKSYGGNLFAVGGSDPDKGSVTNPVPHAFNAGDDSKDQYYYNNHSKKYREMLPIEAVDYSLPIGVVFVVDRSSSMTTWDVFTGFVDGKQVAYNVLDLAKSGAKSLVEGMIRSTGYQDYIGVVSMETTYTREVEPVLATSSNQDLLESAIDNINGEGGGNYFAPAIEGAAQMLSGLPVEKRHIVLITDGMPIDDVNNPTIDASGATIEPYGDVIQRYHQQDGTKLSVVLLGEHGQYGYRMAMEQMPAAIERSLDPGESASDYLFDIDLSGVKSEKDFSSLLTDITQMFTGTIGSNLVEKVKYEDYQPEIRIHNNITAGVTQTLMPNLGGYYGTRPKTGSNTILAAKYVPLYSTWKFGKGQVGAFMCSLNGDSWSSGFLSDPNGKRILLQIAGSLLPSVDIAVKDIDATLTEDNYNTQVNIYTTPLQDNETIKVTVDGPDDANGNAYKKEVTFTSEESVFRADFESRLKGFYTIRIEKLDSSGSVMAEKTYTLYKTFSYSAEYDKFEDDENCKQFLTELANNANGGHLITMPEEAYLEFEVSLHREYDPRTLFMILAIILFLLDIAVRKFKFKWIHEIIRSRKEAKMLNNNK